MKNYKNTILLGLLLLAIIALIVGYHKYNKPHVNVANAIVDYKLSTNELIKKFIIDESGADKKFANKIIEVSGTIFEISTAKGKGVVTLKGNEANVTCQLTDKENKKIMQLKKGQNITIKGQCSGFLMDVMLINCVINKKYYSTNKYKNDN